MQTTKHLVPYFEKGDAGGRKRRYYGALTRKNGHQSVEKDLKRRAETEEAQQLHQKLNCELKNNPSGGVVLEQLERCAMSTQSPG